MSIIKAKLLAFREEFGGYILYAFENMEASSRGDKYIMTVRFPNWNVPVFKVGDIGYLQTKEVIAGESTWYNSQTNQRVAYNYDNIIFVNFIVENEPPSTVLL